MPIEIASAPAVQAPRDRAIVDWQAGAPVYEGDVAEPALETEAPRALRWLLKPGDLMCDWLDVREADSRGLLRLFVNLTLYGKIAAVIAFLVS